LERELELKQLQSDTVDLKQIFGPIFSEA